MDRKTWTHDEMAQLAAVYGLTNTSPQEIERMTMLAERVMRVSGQICRMPSKENEPANTFKVPQ